MSQSQLARAANVPIGTLRNWEQDRRIPRLDTAAAIAKAIGVSLDELAGDVPAREAKQAKAAPERPQQQQGQPPAGEAKPPPEKPKKPGRKKP